MSKKKLDILAIDSQIRQKFQKQQDQLTQYKSQLAELQKTAKFPNLSDRVVKKIHENIDNLTQKISHIENKTDLNFYLLETAELIEQYKKILRTPVKVSFVGSSKGDSKEKSNIIRSYLKKAEKYIERTFDFNSKKKQITCENCQNKEDFIIEENVCICTDCGAEKDIIQQTSSYKDVDRVNISTKYTYDRKVHFRDCINQYQGKQNCTIENKVYTKLEDILERHHLLQGKPGDPREYRFAKITRQNILMFLKELGYSKHYENVILIHSNLTGKKPDDISHLEDRLLNDFDLLIETYDKHFKHKVNRVNFISTQYVLYQLLRKYGHPCNKEDFVILKTTDRKAFHDKICKELFNLNNWSFIPLY